MKNRQDYEWKPNDNSVTTRTRYDLEAEHWYRSFKSAELKYSSNSNSFETIGLIISLLFNIVLLILIGFKDCLKYIKRQF